MPGRRLLFSLVGTRLLPHMAMKLALEAPVLGVSITPFPRTSPWILSLAGCKSLPTCSRPAVDLSLNLKPLEAEAVPLLRATMANGLTLASLAFRPVSSMRPFAKRTSRASGTIDRLRSTRASLPMLRPRACCPRPILTTVPTRFVASHRAFLLPRRRPTRNAIRPSSVPCLDIKRPRAVWTGPGLRVRG